MWQQEQKALQTNLAKIIYSLDFIQENLSFGAVDNMYVTNIITHFLYFLVIMYPICSIVQQGRTFTGICRCILDDTSAAKLTWLFRVSYILHLWSCKVLIIRKIQEEFSWKRHILPMGIYAWLIPPVCIQYIHCVTSLPWLTQPLANGTISILFLRSVLVPSSALSF